MIHSSENQMKWGNRFNKSRRKAGRCGGTSHYMEWFELGEKSRFRVAGGRWGRAGRMGKVGRIWSKLGESTGP